MSIRFLSSRWRQRAANISSSDLHIFSSTCEEGKLQVKIYSDSWKFRRFLRLQVEHQRCVLEAYWVAADGVVDDLAGGEGWLTPVQEHGSGTVSFSIHVVRRRRRRHESISDSWAQEGNSHFSRFGCDRADWSNLDMDLQTHPGVLMVWSAW